MLVNDSRSYLLTLTPPSFPCLHIALMYCMDTTQFTLQGFHFFVRYTLDLVLMPTATPSATPSLSLAPTLSLSPSHTPTSMPSSQPTTNERVFEGGAISAPNGVIYTFENCEPQNFTYFLSVEIYQTDFFDSSEYISAITLNQQSISTFCNPGKDCEPSFYPCLEEETVNRFIDPADGSLTVSVIATGSVNQCPLGEYSLYVRYRLSSLANCTAFRISTTLVDANLVVRTHSVSCSHRDPATNCATRFSILF